ncbi:MAG TPA: histidine phosphatase [Porticoccaceae bacterium]|nr:histidine phosphatase [Porticoccaceae bacterium]
MSEIYFVRHGQASLGARNYDKLSDLGWQQARWLGEHFRELDLQFDRIIVGDMQRHQETLQGIGEGMGLTLTPEVDARLNEFKYFPVLHIYQTIHRPEAKAPKTAGEFFGMLREVMEAWITGNLDAAIRQQDEKQGTKTENWQDFNQRVVGALQHAQTAGARDKVLIVSSGGPKSLAMKHALALSDDATIELMMHIRNTSITRFLAAPERTSLRAFNVLTHLERADREHAITMV